jgi:hypothetical protein
VPHQLGHLAPVGVPADGLGAALGFHGLNWLCAHPASVARAVWTTLATLSS